MQKAKGKRKKFPSWPLSFFLFPFPFFLSSCGTPGDPVPPRPVVPTAVTDLAARQQGDAVVLTFTLPTKSIDGEALAAPPDVEIFRYAPGAVAEQPLYTIPSALTDSYEAEGRFRFSDPLKPESFSGTSGALWEYKVRTRASKRRASADSNAVSVHAYPAPVKAGDLQATVTQDAIELRWSPPERSTTGLPIPSLGAYRVYRALPGATPDAPPALVGVVPTATYRDTQFEFGRTYRYTVRSVAQYEADSVESADSEPVEVTPKDTFPPAAPRDLVLVVVPATSDTPAMLELSWAISQETDLAGYHVYRKEGQSEGQGTAGECLTRELLLVPTFRDTQVASGRRYTYRVTAVDRAGNESALSSPVTGEVPAPGGNN